MTTRATTTATTAATAASRRRSRSSPRRRRRRGAAGVPARPGEEGLSEEEEAEPGGGGGGRGSRRRCSLSRKRRTRRSSRRSRRTARKMEPDRQPARRPQRRRCRLSVDVLANPTIKRGSVDAGGGREAGGGVSQYGEQIGRSGCRCSLAGPDGRRRDAGTRPLVQPAAAGAQAVRDVDGRGGRSPARGGGGAGRGRPGFPWAKVATKRTGGAPTERAARRSVEGPEESRRRGPQHLRDRPEECEGRCGRPSQDGSPDGALRQLDDGSRPGERPLEAPGGGGGAVACPGGGGGRSHQDGARARRSRATPVGRARRPARMWRLTLRSTTMAMTTTSAPPPPRRLLTRTPRRLAPLGPARRPRRPRDGATRPWRQKRGGGGGGRGMGPPSAAASQMRRRRRRRAQRRRHTLRRCGTPWRMGLPSAGGRRCMGTA